jgi:RNA polymerase sigma factor (sigma-70 family)
MLARQSDARLLELHRLGDRRAFEAIVLRYRRELLAYCSRLGLFDGRAEDALQHALLKAWVALQQGTEVRDLHAWLRRIVHNTAVNLMRGDGQDRAVDLESSLVDAASAAQSSLAQMISAREALTDVAALPPMQRDALVLSAIEGRSHDEVARALGVSPIAVRGLLYRARATLRAGASALAPAPLVSWVSRAMSRMAGSVGWASGPSAASERFILGRLVIEGAAVAATAVVAVGAVVGHSHGRSHVQAPAPPQRVAGVTSPSGQNDEALNATSKNAGRQQTITPVAGAGRARRRELTPVPPKPVTASQPTQHPATSNAGTSPDVAGSGESTLVVAGTASGPARGTLEAPAKTEPAPPLGIEQAPAPGSSEGKKSDDEGEAAREAEEEQAETGTELHEREVERERETSEREAEKAREAREEEVDD